MMVSFETGTLIFVFFIYTALVLSFLFLFSSLRKKTPLLPRPHRFIVGFVVAVIHQMVAALFFFLSPRLIIIIFLPFTHDGNWAGGIQTLGGSVDGTSWGSRCHE